MSKPLDKLAFEFFKLFAQFEYALKAMGFARAGRSGQVEPEWDRFANQVGKLVFSSDDKLVAASIDYILKQPPKRQVLNASGLDWEEVSNTERSPQILFAHIGRVRNNLFHGGKFNGRWLDPDRSRILLTHSLTILMASKEADADIKNAIDGSKA